MPSPSEAEGYGLSCRGSWELKLYVKLLFLVGGGWVGQKKTKLMLYSTLVEIEIEVGVELDNKK